MAGFIDLAKWERDLGGNEKRRFEERASARTE
jgi:hypothetical protein